jgi:L-galactono-1,5-lactonase
MIIDAHMHIWKRIRGCVRNEQPVRPVGSGKIRIGDQEMLGMPASFVDCSALAEYVLAEFDSAGVSAGVVVQEYLDGPQNNYLLEVISNYPERFFVHGLPNFFEPDKVEQEAASLFDKGFKGLKVCGGHLLGKVPLDDRRFFSIWERMENEGLVLSVDFSEGEIQVPEFENVMRVFPNLKVAIGHFGMPNRGGWPGQLELCFHKNVYIECGGIIWLYRSEGYPFDSGREALRSAGLKVGYDKIMWGSDWPRTMVDFTYRQSLDFIFTDDAIGSEDKAAIFGANAAELYGFKGPRSVDRIPLITEG